jgi:hypothetical protein
MHRRWHLEPRPLGSELNAAGAVASLVSRTDIPSRCLRHLVFLHPGVCGNLSPSVHASAATCPPPSTRLRQLVPLRPGVCGIFSSATAVHFTPLIPPPLYHFPLGVLHGGILQRGFIIVQALRYPVPSLRPTTVTWPACRPSRVCPRGPRCSHGTSLWAADATGPSPTSICSSLRGWYDPLAIAVRARLLLLDRPLASFFAFLLAWSAARWLRGRAPAACTGPSRPAEFSISTLRLDSWSSDC